MTIAILTISDKGARGERKDNSGEYLKKILSEALGSIVHYEIIPDEKEIIQQKLIYLADEKKVSFIFTTGGTGFSPRDVTPEATKAVIEREVPGFGEIMRVLGYQKTPMAILSRGIAGLRKMTLIINLPGSSTGVAESLEIILPVLKHGYGIIQGHTEHEPSNAPKFQTEGITS